MKGWHSTLQSAKLYRLQRYYDFRFHHLTVGPLHRVICSQNFTFSIWYNHCYFNVIQMWCFCYRIVIYRFWLYSLCYYSVLDCVYLWHQQYTSFQMSLSRYSLFWINGRPTFVCIAGYLPICDLFMRTFAIQCMHNHCKFQIYLIHRIVELVYFSINNQIRANSLSSHSRQFIFVWQQNVYFS